MSARPSLSRALGDAPSWVSAVSLGAAVLIVVDVVLGLVGRSLDPLPNEPAWRRALWSGIVGALSPFVAVGLLSLVGCAPAAGARFRRWFGALAVLAAVAFLVAGVGVVIDGSAVIGRATADRTPLLWTSVGLDALRGLAGALFATVAARALLGSAAPPTATA